MALIFCLKQIVRIEAMKKGERRNAK